MTTSDRPLSGLPALITGGSRGIGAACATELARLGADIVITARGPSAAADEVLATCRSHGVAAHAVYADLGSAHPGQEIIDAASAVRHDYAIVIDNAPAAFDRVRLPDARPDDLGTKAHDDIAVLHRLCLAYGPTMTRRGYGRIIVISSGASWGPTAPGLAAHGISKAAQEAYVRYAATELLAGPVTINALQLGFVNTAASNPVPEAARHLLAAATPAGRVADPADIGGVVGLLAQHAARWINGAAIPVTGGMNYPLNLAALAHPKEH